MMAMWVRMRKCEGLRVKNYKGYIGYNDNSKNYPNY